MGPAGAKKMTITYTPRVPAVIILADGTSKVDTTHIPPRYLTPDVVKAEQKKYAALIIADQPRNAFRRAAQKALRCPQAKEGPQDLISERKKKSPCRRGDFGLRFKVQSSKLRVNGGSSPRPKPFGDDFQINLETRAPIRLRYVVLKDASRPLRYVIDRTRSLWNVVLKNIPYGT